MTQGPPPRSSGQIDGLQAGRGIAALAVAVFHANSHFLPEKLYDGRQAWTGFGMGYAGVEFFFVLSGFLMYHVHRRDFGVPGRTVPYFRKRFLRIYPTFWMIGGPVLAASLVLTGIGPDVTPTPYLVVAALTLFPTSASLGLEVAWTLSHELLFYLVFGLILVAPRAGVAVFGLWMAICVALLPWAETWVWPRSFLFSVYNLLFGFGILAALLSRRLSLRGGAGVFLLGLALFVAVGFSDVFGWLDWPISLRTPAFGAGAVLIVAGLAAAGPVTRKGWVLLGDSSYVLYLSHLPVMAAAILVGGRFGAPWGLPPAATLIILVGLAVAFAMVLHLRIERPMLVWLGNRRARRAV